MIDYKKCNKLKPSLQLKTRKKVSLILYRLGLLINPPKSDIAKINKSVLDKINKAIVSTTSVKPWKGKSDVIKWFESIPEKRESSFVNFDVEDFSQTQSNMLKT